MSEGIIVAIISAAGSIVVGLLAYFGVKSTNRKANEKFESQLITAQAVTSEKITELTREVREHNNFARRVPVVEEQIKVINHRMADAEQTIEKIRKDI